MIVFHVIEFGLRQFTWFDGVAFELNFFLVSLMASEEVCTFKQLWASEEDVGLHRCVVGLTFMYSWWCVKCLKRSGEGYNRVPRSTWGTRWGLEPIGRYKLWLFHCFVPSI